MCGYILGNKLAKFHGNIFSLSENIAKSFRGGYFFDSHCMTDYKRSLLHFSSSRESNTLSVEHHRHL